MTRSALGAASKTPEAAAKLDGALTKFGEALAQDDESLRESQRARLLERHAERALNPTSRRTTSLKQQPR
ncbi:hypothetical protein ACWD7C_34600 [Streptomyces sp. NPDC005134]|uniref:hypothetical protein n=1 Tax=unclassified Streptomyces TaxID=2593676 RepID=UPI0033B80BE5